MLKIIAKTSICLTAFLVIISGCVSHGIQNSSEDSRVQVGSLHLMAYPPENIDVEVWVNDVKICDEVLSRKPDEIKKHEFKRPKEMVEVRVVSKRKRTSTTVVFEFMESDVIMVGWRDGFVISVFKEQNGPLI